jgi:hypothetical protein
LTLLLAVLFYPNQRETKNAEQTKKNTSSQKRKRGEYELEWRRICFIKEIG